MDQGWATVVVGAVGFAGIIWQQRANGRAARESRLLDQMQAATKLAVSTDEDEAAVGIAMLDALSKIGGVGDGVQNVVDSVLEELFDQPLDTYAELTAEGDEVVFVTDSEAGSSIDTAVAPIDPEEDVGGQVDGPGDAGTGESSTDRG